MTPSNDLLVLTSASGKQLHPDVVRHIFGILEAQGACGTLAKIQSCSQVLYRSVNPYLYRHIYIFRSVFERLFGLIVDEGHIEDFNTPTLDPYDETVRWMKLPRLLRIRTLLTLVKKITLTFDFKRDEPQGVLTRALNSLKSDDVEDEVILPNVEAIRFLGSRAYPLYPGKIMAFLGRVSPPKHVCFSHLGKNARLDGIHHMYDGKRLEAINIHQAHEHSLPTVGKYQVRMSYKVKPCSEGCTSDLTGQKCERCNEILSSRVSSLGKILHYVRDEDMESSCPAWKIIAGDGIHKEDEEEIRDMIDEYKKRTKSRLQRAIQDLGEAREGDELDEDDFTGRPSIMIQLARKGLELDKKRLEWFVRGLSVIPYREGLREPPCEVCGEQV